MNEQFIDKLSIEKDIIERRQIIQEYQRTRFLDRNNVISKIIELREKDDQFALVTCAMISPNPVLLEQLTDKGLIEELQTQIRILEAKLLS